MGPDSRTRRRIARLSEALDGLRQAVAAVVAACPPQPSAQDRPALARIAGDLPGIVEGIKAAARPLRGEAVAARALTEAKVSAPQALRLAAALAHLAEAGRTPLMPPAAVLAASAEERRMAILSSGFLTLERAIAGEQEAAIAGSSFPFVPRRPDQFVAALQAAWRLLAAQGRETGARYLEIGAGAGSKLHLARQVFESPEGIELDAGYLERARLLAVDDGAILRRADATEFDRYGDYDVIYSYVPLRDIERQSALERRIEAAVRPGTVIIAPAYTVSHFQRIDQAARGVIVAGHSGAALAALVAQAERVGPVAPPDLPRPHRLDRHDIALPGLRAVAGAGFAL